MKKINVYYFNDGYDGVVAAKSLKHAIKIMTKNSNWRLYDDLINFPKQARILKLDYCTCYKYKDWYIEEEKRVKGKKGYKKSDYLGWME